MWCMGVVHGCGAWVWCMGVVHGWSLPAAGQAASGVHVADGARARGQPWCKYWAQQRHAQAASIFISIIIISIITMHGRAVSIACLAPTWHLCCMFPFPSVYYITQLKRHQAAAAAIYLFIYLYSYRSAR